MGVTIHFEGRLKSAQDLNEVLRKGHELAKRLSQEPVLLDSGKKLLKRIRNEEDWDYEGPVKGIQFSPHINSDPLVLEFDRDHYIQEYCKTQFAGVSTHIKIIEFLRDIEPHFQELQVVDEGEFWESSEIKVLEQKFNDFFDAFEKAIQENPKLKGPFRIEGRIIDLME